MKIQVRYWRGTQRFIGVATTYRGAMRIASRNQNAYLPTFWAADGRKLMDDGQGLAYEDDLDAGGVIHYAI
jgi:hypothetical protein